MYLLFHNLKGMNGYQKSLSNGINIQGFSWESKFSVSQKFKEIELSINSSHNAYAETAAKCILYFAELKQGIKVFYNCHLYTFSFRLSIISREINI